MVKSSSEFCIFKGKIRDLNNFEGDMIMGNKKADESLSETANFLCFSRTRMSSLQIIASKPNNFLRKVELWMKIAYEQYICHATNTHYLQQQMSCNTTICSII